MNTQNYHTHMRIKTLNKEWSKWEWGIPWHQTINALSREVVSAQLRNNFEHVIEQNQINHAWQLNQSINQSIIYVGPPPKPVYFSMNQFYKFHHLELRKLISYLFKTFWNSEELWKLLAGRKNDSEFYLKSGFLRPKTLRMKFRRRELKSFEKYLKIGIYGVVLK